MRPRYLFVAVIAAIGSQSSATAPQNSFRAGAAVVKVNPVGLTDLGGHVFPRKTDVRLDDLHARCLVLDDGKERIALAIVDSNAIDGDLGDDMKRIVASETKISTDRILIAATHNHSSPRVIATAGLDRDEAYVALLKLEVPRCIAIANANLEPARVGWTVYQDSEHTHTRRWIRRPDRVDADPLGARNVRANMQPGFNNPDVIGPSGPSDPDLSVLALQSLDERPIAVLANYAQHYYAMPALADGTGLITADYFGLVSKRLSDLVATDGIPPQSGGFNSRNFDVDRTKVPEQPRGPGPGAPHNFVAMFAQGTSGDQMWQDFSQKELKDPGVAAYSDVLAQGIFQAYKQISYQDHASLHMVETVLAVEGRQPTSEELEKAQSIVSQMNNKESRSWREAFALRAVEAANLPKMREIKLQAIAIGNLGLTAIPAEVYALTGLKLKRKSPFSTTINMTLANGRYGYIPPPEQFDLGGYTTWTATESLARDAEPRILEATLKLLEQASGWPRRTLEPTNGIYAKAVLEARPLAYWRLEDMDGVNARDSTGHGISADFEKGFAFYLEGPESSAFSGDSEINRAVHLAGGRITSRLRLPAECSIEFWIWNGMPYDVRDVTGKLFSDGVLEVRLDRKGQLVLAGSKGTVSGPAIAMKTWHHIALVRRGTDTTLFLDGNPVGSVSAKNGNLLVFGGGVDEADSFEGKIDEIAIYNRPLSLTEIRDRVRLVSSHE